MRLVVALLLICTLRAQEPAPVAIEIDLTAQKAWVLQEGQRVYETAISSGRAGHETAGHPKHRSRKSPHRRRLRPKRGCPGSNGARSCLGETENRSFAP